MSAGVWKGGEENSYLEDCPICHHQQNSRSPLHDSKEGGGLAPLSTSSVPTLLAGHLCLETTVLMSEVGGLYLSSFLKVKNEMVSACPNAVM